MTEVLSARIPRKYVKAVRSGRRDGKLVCVSCGHLLPTAQMAARIGVTSGQLAAFLNHRTVREDVAKKIRESVMEVDE